MTKILIMSDSHGDARAFREAIEAQPAVRDVIFLGDGARDLDEMQDAFPQHNFYGVRGNCDMGSFLSTEGFIPFEGMLVMYTHGHLYDVKSSRAELAIAAAEKGVDVVVYGHTHIARQEQISGVLLCNPGALCGARTGLSGAGYGILTLDQGQATFVCAQLI